MWETLYKYLNINSDYSHSCRIFEIWNDIESYVPIFYSLLIYNADTSVFCSLPSPLRATKSLKNRRYSAARPRPTHGLKDNWLKDGREPSHIPNKKRSKKQHSLIFVNLSLKKIGNSNKQRVVCGNEAHARYILGLLDYRRMGSQSLHTLYVRVVTIPIIVSD